MGYPYQFATIPNVSVTTPKVADAAVAQLITKLLQDAAARNVPPRVRAAA